MTRVDANLAEILLCRITELAPAILCPSSSFMTSSHPAIPTKVLIVDDEPGMARLMAYVLTAAGYHAEAAVGGPEGWKQFQTGPWSVVISDWTMEGLSGDDLAQRIERHSPGTPVIIATGRPHAISNLALYASVMMKPFGRLDLLNAVDQALQRSTLPLETT